MIDKYYLLTVMSEVFVRLIAIGRVGWSIVVLIVGLGTARGQPYFVGKCGRPTAGPARCDARARRQ